MKLRRSREDIVGYLFCTLLIFHTSQTSLTYPMQAVKEGFVLLKACSAGCTSFKRHVDHALSSAHYVKLLLSRYR